MSESKVSVYRSLAEALRYPAPGRMEHLEQLCLALPAGSGRNALQSFLDEIRSLSLGQWEELYTRTWDLNPLAPPYIGFQIWGEDYRRGVFLARLQRAYQELEIDTGGELPDHLVPVLVYLDTAPAPVSELMEVFHKAVEKMTASLEKRERRNPYLHLLKWMADMELPTAETDRA